MGDATTVSSEQNRMQPRTSQQARRRWLRYGWLILALGWTALALLGFILMLSYINEEKERDMRQWHIRLGLMADHQVAEINRWLDKQFDMLDGITTNPSVQLFITEQATANAPSEAPAMMAQSGFMRNLLNATVLRATALHQSAANTAMPMKAGVEGPPAGGIALINRSHTILASSRGFQLPPVLRTFAQSRELTESLLFGPFKHEEDGWMIGLMQPVTAVQQDAGESQPVGYALAVLPLSAAFFDMLTEQPLDVATVETLLLRRVAESQIEYMSPVLLGGYNAFELRMDASTPELAASHALTMDTPFALRTDYRNQLVLMTSRPVNYSNWTMMLKIDAAEVLAESDQRGKWMVGSYLLAVLLVSVSMLAVWRHATAVRARHAAAHYRALANRIEKQDELFELITSATPNAIFIIDNEHYYRYANRVAAERARMEPRRMIGKTITAVLGASKADAYLKASRAALADNNTHTVTHRVPSERAGEGEDIFESTHIPLENIPLPQTNQRTPGTLIIEKDQTRFVHEKERRERILHHLVESMVSLVDKRDPYAASHSRKVAAVAGHVAREMGLVSLMVETAETAGRLMNLGKILVPESLLTQKEVLDEEGRARIRNSIQATADLLSAIEFDGPVIDTLRQSQERADGNGPLGLKGDDILPPAQVVIVANSFVALVSERAYRPGATIDEALRVMMDDIGVMYNRAPVAALVNYIDNHRGREDWELLGETHNRYETASEPA